MANGAVGWVGGEPVPAAAREGARSVGAHLIAVVLTVRALVHVHAHRVVVDEEAGGTGTREAADSVAALAVL